MNDETIMLIEQQQRHAETVNLRLTDFEAYMTQLDERFKWIQVRTRNSELAMTIAYIELHELWLKLDKLEAALATAIRE